MTLIVLDENKQEVTEDNPIITEHNGSTGDSVILPFTLVNKSSRHYHRNVRLQVKSVFPVDMGILMKNDSPEKYLSSMRIARLNPKETVSFNLQVSIPFNTPEQVVKGTNLVVSSMQYPMH